MDDIQKLHSFSVISKVLSELDRNAGLKDRILAEFIIKIALDAKDVDNFTKQLEQSGAEFPIEFMKSIYSLINRMRISNLEPEIDTGPEADKLEENPSKLAGMPPGSLLYVPRRQSKDGGIDEKIEDSKFEDDAEKNDKEFIAKKFPALTLPNKSKEELDLDLDLLYDSGDKKPEIKEQENLIEPQKSETKHSRKKSTSSSHSKHHHHHSSRHHHHRHKHSSSRSRSYSRSRSRSRSRSKHHSSRHHKKSESPENEEPIAGKIYEGIVTRVEPYGAFIRLNEFRNIVDGLLHISQIPGREKVRNATDLFTKNQKVKVAVLSINGHKISLTMKGLPDAIYEVKSKDDKNEGENLIEELKNNPTKPIDPLGTATGKLTGIRIDTEDSKQKAKKRIPSPLLWEISQMKGGQVYQESDDAFYNPKTGKIEYEEADEEDPDLELNEAEPAFLKNQTTRSGVAMSPVKVTRAMEGTLQRIAMNQAKLAKQRKEKRDEERRAKVEPIQVPKESEKLLDDPASNLLKRDIMNTLTAFGGNPNDLPEWKLQSIIKNSGLGKRSSMTIKEQRESLPIYKLREPLMDAIAKNSILVIIGETGSGKTTQIPQYLKEEGYTKKGKIACTQPRRVAAMSVAKRVSDEVGTKLGDLVGYSIRFEDCTSERTVLKYMTDGMLLRESLIDPSLRQYSVIMLDEAHERTVQTDVLFGLMKNALKARPDLKVIVTSATLDAEKFSSYFYDCPIFKIPGNTYDVEILYAKEPESDYLDAALNTVMQIHLGEPKGDILVFLTGQEEIDTAVQTLNERIKGMGNEVPPLIALPVYSALPSEMQAKIFEPAPEGSRKCVIATNIAEASLTIDGIFYVVDPGFAKIKVYNPKLQMDQLVVCPISRASAKQRAGRAGRTGPGKCYRLYTLDAYKNEMLPDSVPEIQRTNLANIVLTLKAMGINDLLNFDFMDPPPVKTLVAAMEELYNLGALDTEGLLTKIGRIMAEFPLDPPLSKMLLTSVDLSCSDEIVTIVGMLSVQNVFYRPRDKQSIADQKRAKFSHPDGDHLTMLTVYEAWRLNNSSSAWCFENFIHARALKRALDVRNQLIDIFKKFKLPLVSCGKDYAKVRKAITAGFFTHAARKDQEEGYKTLQDARQVYIHPSSALFNRNPEWVIYHELVLTSKEYMREICTIDPKWLVDVAPNYCKFADPNSISKRKKQEKLEPLHNKFEDPNAWRLSRRKG